MSEFTPLSRVVDLMAEASVSRRASQASIAGTPLTPAEKAAMLDAMREQIRTQFVERTAPTLKGSSHG